MTKKDYEAVAQVIRVEVVYLRSEKDVDMGDIAMNAVRRIADGLCFHFIKDNAAFQKARFLEACGL